MFHVSEGVAGRSPTGKLVVDPVKLRPVSRLGGLTYGLTTRLFNLARPDGKGRYPPAPAAAAANAVAAQQPSKAVAGEGASGLAR